ncbi:MAG: hypothetical protein CBD97_01570 [Pelagibacteraceae bacterium TMED237]|nr:hypothetical protein [Candidatus Neomarinimicrobiota bacterium]OUW96316.1 MAG: hypothetical protein CBD97_01570 [Pelagibacteraceae bacterium TMED237]
MINQNQSRVLIDYNIDDDIIGFIKKIDYSQVVIFTQKSIYQLQSDFINRLKNQFNAIVLIIKESDISKDILSATNSITKMVEANVDKDSLLIAYGGGSVSDHVGFIASIFKRGVKYINIPTTLIGMIDASIGGKTALNIGNIKNQIGTFYQPVKTFIDLEQINSMPNTIIKDGFGEMFKYAILSGQEMFYEFHSYIKRKDKSKLHDLIQKCCDIKLNIVEADEKDKNIRKTLNLGHTFGHAIESDSKRQVSHGIAVINGICMEAFLSFKMNCLSKKEFELIYLLSRELTDYSYYVDDIEKYVNWMRSDKKNKNNKIAVIMIKKLGEVELQYFYYDEICSIIKDYNEYFSN